MKMTYATLLNSEDRDAEALSVVEIRPGLCDVEDLSSHGKITLRGSETQENDLEVDADGCVDDLQGTTDDNRVQPSKPQRYNKNQHLDEETPTSGGCSSRVLPFIFNAKVLLGLFVGLLAVDYGAGAYLNHTDVHKAAGIKVKLRFKCPTDYCQLKFHNFAKESEQLICDGRDCDEGYTFDEDSLCFVADYKTAGRYSLVDYNTKVVFVCIELTIDTTAAERQTSRATSNALPSGLLIVLTVVLGYFIHQKLIG